MTDEWTRAEKRKAQSEQAKAIMDFVSMLSDKINELEKENAELKRRLDNLFNSDCWASDQLAIAKEHIQTLISCLIDWVQEGDKDYCYIADAEQFLKECK